MKEMFLAYDQECCKVQLKVTSLSKKWIFLFVITKKQTLVFRYMSSMQLNIEIKESIWFLTTPATVLGVSNSYQTRTGYIYIYIKTFESPFLLHYQDSTLTLVVIQSVLRW